MKLVFMGTPDFAVPSLEALLKSVHDVTAVVTQPDRPWGRGRVLTPPPVKDRAVEAGLPVLQPDSLSDPDFLRKLKKLKADLYVVVAFRILPPEVLVLPERGCINLHASLLPRYRGAAPIQWAVINGEERTGLTTFFIEKTVDTGKIIGQVELDIEPDETSGELSLRLRDKGACLLSETVDAVAQGEGKYEVREQPASGSCPAPKITPDDGRLDWDSGAEELRNRIRGLNPVPGAYSFFGEKKFKVYRAVTVAGNGIPAKPGRLTLRPDGALVVSCGTGGLVLKEVQLEGKKRLAAWDFVRGTDIPEGARLD